MSNLPDNVVQIHHPPMTGLQSCSVPFRNMRFWMRLKFAFLVALGRNLTFVVPGMSVHIQRVTPMQPQPEGYKGFNA